MSQRTGMLDGPGFAPPDANERYRRLLERLYALARSGSSFGLGPIARVLADLGHPELAFPSVHVAGSNGKGSTCAFIASILSAHRLKTGLYTSPHLVSLTERVQIVEDTRAREITHDALASAVEAVEAVAHDFADLTFFEVLTAAGLIALAREAIDVGVIEAGLGARLDATRLVDAHVSVLTDLALEHTHILGDTLEEIAREKAAVARPSRPLVAADAPAGAAAVIAQAANEVGAKLYRIGRELDVRAREDGSFDLELGDRSLLQVQLSLLGPHQGRNAVLAAKAAVLIAPEISDAELRRGLERAAWPGRMEIVRPRDGGPPLLLDGAHNPHGMESLARALTAHRATIKPPLHFVFGILGDKDARPMLDLIEPLAASIVLTRPGTARARAPAELWAMLAAEARGRSEVVEGVTDAVAAARARAARDNGWVVVCGSLYLVGDARAALSTLI